MKKTAFLIMLITVISKFIGFIRELTLSYFYGASNISDAYIISITVPSVIFAIIGVGINNGYIPMYTKIESEYNKEIADKYTNNFTNITLIATGVAFVIGFIFTDTLVKLFAKGFSGETLMLATKFTRITILGIFFTALTYIFRGYLQIKGDFIIPSFIGLPFNFIIIISIILSEFIGLYALGLGFLIATASQFLFILPLLRRNGYKHSLYINFKDKNIMNMISIVLPIIIGSSVNQINLLVDRTIASSLAVGGISAMNYAYRLNQFVQGLFVLSIVTVMYPTISKIAIKKDYNYMIKVITECVTLLTIILIPISVITMIFSRDIVEILFKRGNFDGFAVIMTSKILFFIGIGMLSSGLREVLTRVFYSLQDVKTPVINGSIAMGLNIILNIILSKILGIYGLALATSISVTVCTLLLGYNLDKKVGGINISRILVNIIKITLISITMGIIIYGLYNLFKNNIDYKLALVASNTLGLIIYFFMILYTKIINPNDIKSILKKTKI